MLEESVELPYTTPAAEDFETIWFDLLSTVGLADPYVIFIEIQTPTASPDRANAYEVVGAEVTVASR